MARISKVCNALASFLALSLATIALAQQPVHPSLQQAPASPSKPKLVGYFPQWGLYNQPQYTVKNLVPNSPQQYPMLDQINYAQSFVTGGRCSIADPNADLNYTFTAAQSVDGKADDPTHPFRGNLHQLQLLKQRYPTLRILISLEGRASDFAFDAQPENRGAFIDSCVDLFIRGNLAPGIAVPGLFDGIDIDWETPHQADAENFRNLLLELRQQMDAIRPGTTLSVAVGPSPHMFEGSDMGAISKLVDQIGLMTYDFNGPWSETTGFLAPLAAAPDYDGGTVTHSINAYLAAGVPASHLLMGVPFYGYGWRLVPEEAQGLLQEGQAIRGDRPYRYIETLIPQSTLYRDPIAQTPWLFDGDVFWTFDDPISIQHKAAYAIDNQLGGLMIWELGQDTVTGTLLQAAHQGLHPRTPSPPVVSVPQLKSPDAPS